jgi:hypothetical protein
MIMIDKIKYFFYKYVDEITWFIIGFLTCNGITALARGDWFSALIDFGLAYLNYAINKR